MVLFMFFFFKQKTASEIRISDWSSDVCSSDLSPRVIRASDPRTSRATFRTSARKHCATSTKPGSSISVPKSARATSDRKSVVEGKSVSVRVDLGGRRIIQKKKKK